VGRIDDIANRYVEDWAPLNPVGATFVGILGYDDKLTNLSPAGFEAQADLARRALADLRPEEPGNEQERVAKEAMLERLGRELALHDAGEVISEVNVISSPLHGVRSVFDLMPTEGAEAAAAIAARMAAVPTALTQWKQTLEYAADRGYVSARHQILEVANQCEMWTDEAGDNFFPELVARVKRDGPVPDALAADLDRGAVAATAAVIELAGFLRGFAPRGREKQAAGRERYELTSQFFLGARIDLEETYQWGFEELARLEGEMNRTQRHHLIGGFINGS